MVRRQRFAKLPTQANYYPLPAAAYIEDTKTRLTVATAQPLGVASMGTGQIEVVIANYATNSQRHRIYM